MTDQPIVTRSARSREEAVAMSAAALTLHLDVAIAKVTGRAGGWLVSIYATGKETG